jgi:hypothetical protein
MDTSIVIESRYNGPPQSGNGGYSAGRFAVASGVTQPVEVTLRRPPPLDVALSLSTEDDAVRLVEPGGELVAEARSATLAAGEVVAPVGWDEAVAVSAGYPGFTNHPFPTCFVCGPQRAEGDGLRLFPGRLPDGRTATPFRVPATQLTPELVWAALDCPGGWAVPLEGRAYVLGRIAARVDDLAQAGQHCVVMGAMTGEQGRKAFTLTTLYGPDGTVLAAARATWVAIA